MHLPTKCAPMAPVQSAYLSRRLLYLLINLLTMALPKLFDCENVNLQQTFVCNAVCTKSLTINFMRGHFLA